MIARCKLLQLALERPKGHRSRPHTEKPTVDATTATDSNATAGSQETPSPTASTASAGGLLAIPPLPARPAWRGLPVGPPGRRGRAPLIEPLVSQTLPRSQSRLRSKFKHPLAIVVVQLCAVDELLAARLAHRRWEGHRETIRACGQPMQKSTIGRAHADLHRDDSRLSETSEPSIVA